MMVTHHRHPASTHASPPISPPNRNQRILPITVIFLSPFVFSFRVNLIWIVFFGLEMAIGYVILGCLWCITLLGIPIGKQCFKMAKLSLMPFGASVI